MYDLSFTKNGWEYKSWDEVHRRHNNAPTSFRPVPALKMCHLYSATPKCVLDFCSGWGDRLAGVSAANVPLYIGIDSNSALTEPYKDMIASIKEFGSTTECTMILRLSQHRLRHFAAIWHGSHESPVLQHWTLSRDGSQVRHGMEWLVCSDFCQARLLTALPAALAAQRAFLYQCFSDNIRKRTGPATWSSNGQSPDTTVSQCKVSRVYIATCG